MKETPDKSDPATSHIIRFCVVEQASSAPVGGAEVRIASVGPEIVYSTDPEGLCKLVVDGNSPHGVMVAVCKQGFVPMRVVWDRSESSSQLPGDYTIALEAATSIGGRVQNEEGEAVGGATVFLAIWSRRKMEGVRVMTDIFDRTAVTDAEGKWHFDEAPADLTGLMFRVSHVDYVEEMHYARAEMPTEQFRNGTMAMVLKKGIRVEGVVTDHEGKPVADAEVLPGRDRVGSGVKPSFRTDAAGRFSMVRAPEGRASITVKAEGHAPALVEFPAMEGMGPLQIILDPARQIRGRVVNLSGEPLAGAIVFADTWRHHRTLELHLKTDDEGRFEWKNAPADEVLFDFVHHEYRSWRRIPLTASDEEHVIVLRKPLMMRGTVKDARTGASIDSFSIITGEMHDNHRIYWRREGALDFSGGSFLWRFMGDTGGGGVSLMRAEAEGYLSGVSRIDDSEEEGVLNFLLEPGPATSGRVLCADGSPASGAKLVVVSGSSAHIQGKELNASHGNMELAADAEGKFNFPSQEPPYAIVAVHETGCAVATAEEFAQNPVLQTQGWGRVEIATETGTPDDEKIPFYIRYENILKYGEGMPWVTVNPKPERTAGNRIIFENLPPGNAWLGRYGQANHDAVSLCIKGGETIKLDFDRGVAAGGKDGTAMIVIKVVDEGGNPVEGAMVMEGGFRLKSEPGVSYSMSLSFGENETRKTNRNGVVMIGCPKFPMKKGMEVKFVNVVVKHPDFCTARANCPTEGESLPVILRRGGTLKISGFFEAGGKKADDVHVQTRANDRDAEIDMDTWIHEEGGILSNRQVPRGSGFLRVVSLPENGPAHFSDIVEIAVEEGESRGIHVALRPGMRFHGKLEDSVPRPIVHGRVDVNVTTVVSGGSESMEWHTWRDIEADGTFVFDSLPEGAVELIAICEGFASKNRAGSETEPQRTPQVFQTEKEANPVTVEMERTAVCEAHAADEQRKPMVGATVHLSPNVRWNSGSSGIFAGALLKQEELISLNREERDKRMREKRWAFNYQGTTDENGAALIANLPRGKHLLTTHLQGYRMMSPSGRMGARFCEVEMLAGEVTKVHIVMRKE